MCEENEKKKIENKNKRDGDDWIKDWEGMEMDVIEGLIG